jgi:hypothetical protein
MPTMSSTPLADKAKVFLGAPVDHDATFRAAHASRGEGPRPFDARFLTRVLERGRQARRCRIRNRKMEVPIRARRLDRQMSG